MNNNAENSPIPSELVSLAHRVFGSEDKAEAWLSESLPALGHNSPRLVCQSPDGYVLVKAILTKIEHGEFI